MMHFSLGFNKKIYEVIELKIRMWEFFKFTYYFSFVSNPYMRKHCFLFFLMIAQAFRYTEMFAFSVKFGQKPEH